MATFTTQVAWRMDPATNDRLTALAVERGITRSEMLALLLEDLEAAPYTAHDAAAPPGAPTQLVNLAIDQEAYERLQRLAAAYGWSQSAVLRRAVLACYD